jgi:hypothetical protein
MLKTHRQIIKFASMKVLNASVPYARPSKTYFRPNLNRESCLVIFGQRNHFKCYFDTESREILYKDKDKDALKTAKTGLRSI